MVLVPTSAHVLVFGICRTPTECRLLISAASGTRPRSADLGRKKQWSKMEFSPFWAAEHARSKPMSCVERSNLDRQPQTPSKQKHWRTPTGSRCTWVWGADGISGAGSWLKTSHGREATRDSRFRDETKGDRCPGGLSLEREERDGNTERGVMHPAGQGPNTGASGLAVGCKLTEGGSCVGCVGLDSALGKCVRSYDGTR